MAARHRPAPGIQPAAFLRLAASRASTVATVWSTVGVAHAELRRRSSAPAGRCARYSARHCRARAPRMTASPDRAPRRRISRTAPDRSRDGAHLSRQPASPSHRPRARHREVAVHRFLDGDRAVRSDAAVIAGQQHRPFRQRHENRVVHLELDRQIDRRRRRGRSGPPRYPPASGAGSRCARRRSKRAALKLVGRVTCSTLIFSSGGRNACGSGLHRVSKPGIEIVPHAGVGVAGLQRVGGEAGDALQIGQRRHVHDRHARHPRLRHRVEQFAHAGRAVLRLLHRQRPRDRNRPG